MGKTNLPAVASKKRNRKANRYPMLTPEKRFGNTGIIYQQDNEPVWAASSKLAAFANRYEIEPYHYLVVAGIGFVAVITLGSAGAAILAGVGSDSLSGAIFFIISTVVILMSLLGTGVADFLGRQHIKQWRNGFYRIPISSRTYDLLEKTEDGDFKNNMFEVIKNADEADSDETLITKLLMVWNKFESLPDNVRADLQAPLLEISANFPETSENTNLVFEKLDELEKKAAPLFKNQVDDDKKMLAAKAEIERAEINNNFDRAIQIATDESFIVAD